MGTSGTGPDCVNCGARLPSGATRCHMCGASMQIAHLQRRCPNCGTAAARAASTCLMCNAPLNGLPIRAGLTGLSWSWVAVVALVVVLIGVGWSRRPSGPQAEAVVPAPTYASSSTPTPLPTFTATPVPSDTPTPIPSPTPIFHEVQPGETIIYIASYYGTSPEAVMEANGLDETSARLLRPGQRIAIPSTGPVGGPIPGEAEQPVQVVHEVEAGETLSSIAAEYGTTVDAIIAATGLDSPDLIYVGQPLVVPVMPPTSTPTPTPLPPPTSTPSPPYSAPHLLSPADDSVFEQDAPVVLLSWTSVGILPDDQAYLVEVETPARSSPVIFLTQGTSWRLPADMRPAGRRRGLTWHVTVVKTLGSSSETPLEWKPLSPPSEARHFVWR